MSSLNSFFSDPQPLKQPVPKKHPQAKKTSNKQRKTRSDKRHNVKFPVNKIEHMQLKTACKQASSWYKAYKKKDLTQTTFNTYLLNYALKNLEIVDWNRTYKDSKRYMHTQALESDYQAIGGPYGLAIQKGLSERKVVYYLVISALEKFRREGNYVEIFQ